MDNYEKHNKRKEKYLEDNADLIGKVIDRETPQEILWEKCASDAFENAKEGRFMKRVSLENENGETEEKFVFSEKMANKLMHFAFLKGKLEGAEEGKKEGYEDCMDEVAESLGLCNRKLCC